MSIEVLLVLAFKIVRGPLLVMCSSGTDLARPAFLPQNAAVSPAQRTITKIRPHLFQSGPILYSSSFGEQLGASYMHCKINESKLKGCSRRLPTRSIHTNKPDRGLRSRMWDGGLTQVRPTNPQNQKSELLAQISRSHLKWSYVQLNILRSKKVHPAFGCSIKPSNATLFFWHLFGLVRGRRCSRLSRKHFE